MRHQLLNEGQSLTVSVPPAPEFGEPLPGAASSEVLAFLARRRSASALQLRAPAPSAGELDDLLRLAARVPDHGKLGPWRFVVLEGAAKDSFAARLEHIATNRPDGPKAIAKLGKIKTPPMAVVVISNVVAGSDIPEWEQQMSAGAVCSTLLMATSAMGYGANWITDWYAYDKDAIELLGLTGSERVAGFVLLGTPTDPSMERPRPDLASRITRWAP